MNLFHASATLACLIGLASCAGGPKSKSSGHMASESLADRLGRSHGYQVDEKGNWLPRSNKRSQYEGRGGSAYFNGELGKKSFNTKSINKSSWMGGKALDMPEHRLSGTDKDTGGNSRFHGQQASLDRSLQTPARIDGNHLPTHSAREGSSASIDKPSDAETDVRRRVFKEPDIIDWRQQRDLSIQQSKQLLGKD